MAVIEYIMMGLIVSVIFGIPLYFIFINDRRMKKLNQLVPGYNQISGNDEDDVVSLYVNEIDNVTHFKLINKKINVTNQLELHGDIIYPKYRSFMFDLPSVLENAIEYFNTDTHYSVILNSTSNKLYVMRNHTTSVFDVNVGEFNYIHITCTDGKEYDTKITLDGYSEIYTELLNTINNEHTTGVTNIFEGKEQIYLRHIVTCDLRKCITRSINTCDDELLVLDNRYYDSDGKFLGRHI